MLTAATTLAEEAQDAPRPAEAAADSEVPNTADKVDEGDESRGPIGEIFIPTEEISEDFAVSFPVDI